MATFLLEVGTEELPARFVDSALEQWRGAKGASARTSIPQRLSEQNLQAESIAVYGTPRRLAVLIQGLPHQQPDQEMEFKGPAVQAAFKEGKPTKAAEGFARSRNVSLADLEIRTTDKGEFVFVRQTIPGRPTAEILTELIPQWILNLEGPRLMRWGDGDLRFSRPIHWLVALLDDQILPVELHNGCFTVSSDRISQGHRVLHPQPIVISQAADYLQCLRQASVEVNPEQRQMTIQQQVQAAAEHVNGWAEIYPALLQEVVQLVEWPTAVVGKFDPEFLSLPPEVITTVMVSHQRYFPVRNSQTTTELLPYFITVSNGDPQKSDIIAAGNERVIRARLADGQFFYKADLAKPLEQYLPQLETVTFQGALGSMRAKVDRIGAIAQAISGELSEPDNTHIQRAALLCKADLVTQMVGEFPELQGIMGEKYALACGESTAVATAIAEHYLPKGAGDQLPQTLAGQVVGIADRMDTLVSIFGLGMLPTGSSDPFALRRAANAIVNILWQASLPLDLLNLLQTTVTAFAKIYEKANPELLSQQLQEFFLQRIRSLLEEQQIDYDLINAILGDNDPEYAERALRTLLDVRDRARFLQTIRQDGRLEPIYETVNRASRLAAQGDLPTTQLEPTSVINPQLFQKSSEQSFYEALLQLAKQMAQGEQDYPKLIESLQDIAPTISNFFDGPESVLVMDSNSEIKTNRLNLLGLLRNQTRRLADFGAIVKS
jgi:glycyl-tRNA synthetase beta chain